MPNEVLSPAERRFMAAERRAILATVTPEGRPRLVPVCFVLTDKADRIGRPIVYTPVDEKPKKSDDPMRLGRVQDLLVLPDASILVDRWDENWARLAWVRADGSGEILEPQAHEREEHAEAVGALREKYPQYREQALDERPIIRLTLTRAISWGNLD
jgi:PPOX class probable F420-dependent enzyme